MKKILIAVVMAFCFSTISIAQDYNTGIGIRGGPFTGLTLKHFVSERSAFEFLLATRWRGLEITGLYEIHNRAFDAERLRWYYGFGAHAGFYNGDYTHNKWGEKGNEYSVLGLDGILGLEYSFEEIPFNVSIDWKPSFNFYGYSGFWADGVALSIRYIF